MGMNDISDPAAIRKAAAEFDELGRAAFLDKYGFGEAREFFLALDGKLYDSKAIVGAAHGFQFAAQGPLRANQFSGGEATVERKLKKLGFRVRRATSEEAARLAVASGHYASSRLKLGAVYTREDLARMFEIEDATLNTGVFIPRGYASIWLFVTRSKTSDRTQYEDNLVGDTLFWQGQTEGRTDHLVIDHSRGGLELLLFYRNRKDEYDHGGFLYEGPFKYESHRGSHPTSFIVKRVGTELEFEAAHIEQEEPFDPSSVEDGRKRVLQEVVRRQGQQSFRANLLEAYGNRCCISNCDVVEVLEAAHIFPFRGDETNHITNGLLLRADLHTLFDLGLIAVDSSSFSVVVKDSLRASPYGEFHGRALAVPADPKRQPSKDALKLHREQAASESGAERALTTPQLYR